MGFKQRTVVDPSTRLYAEADEKLKNAKAAIKNQEWQDSTQIQALKNADIQLTKNEVYFLKAHEKMWNEILSTVGPGGPVQKVYIEWGREQAAKGAIAGNEEYDEQKYGIEKSGTSQVTEALKTEQKIQGAVSDVADQQKSQVKKGEIWADKNHWYKSGAMRAMEARRAADFSLDVQNYLTTSEDTLSYTDSSGNQIPFIVKNYTNIEGTPKAHAVAVREYAAKKIAEAVERGLSAQYVAEKIVPLINKQSSTIIKDYNIAWNKADARKNITKSKDVIHDSINLGLTPIAETLQAQRKVIHSQHGRLNTPEAWKETDKELKETIESALKAKVVRNESIDEVLKEIEAVKYKFPWLKEPATLGEAKPEEFGPEAMEVMKKKIENGIYDINKKNDEVQSDAGIKQIDQAFLDGASTSELAKMEANYIAKWGDKFPEKVKKMLDRSDLKKGTKDGFAWANQLIKDKGKIDAWDLSKLNAETRDMLVEKHGEYDKWYEPIGINEKISAEQLKASKEVIDGALNKVLNLATKDDATNDIVARVRQYVYGQLGKETREQIRIAKLNGEDLSDRVDVAASRAATKIATDIVVANENPSSTSLLRSTPTEGFKFFDERSGTFDHSKEVVSAKNLLTTARWTENNSKNDNAILEQKITMPENLFELTNADEVKPVFTELERITGHDRNEIYKAQAKLNGFNVSEPKTWDGQDLIKEKISPQVQASIRKNPENTKQVERTIDDMGGIAPVQFTKILNKNPQEVSKIIEDTKAVSTAPTKNIFIRQMGVAAMGYAPNALDSQGVPLYKSLERSSNGRTYASITAEVLRFSQTGGLEI